MNIRVEEAYGMVHTGVLEVLATWLTQNHLEQRRFGLGLRVCLSKERILLIFLRSVVQSRGLFTHFGSQRLHQKRPWMIHLLTCEDKKRRYAKLNTNLNWLVSSLSLGFVTMLMVYSLCLL